jgi:hypothetical protein
LQRWQYMQLVNGGICVTPPPPCGGPCKTTRPKSKVEIEGECNDQATECEVECEQANECDVSQDCGKLKAILNPTLFGSVK